MDEQKKKERDWSFLFPNGKPTGKQRLELKKIKDSMVELELDVDGYDFDTEASFCDFVMAKNTPGDSVVDFLKKSLSDANIDFVDTGFRRLDKKGYLELFFEVFTVGTNESGDNDTVVNCQGESDNENTSQAENDITDDKAVADNKVEYLTMEAMDGIYKSGEKKKVSSISYADFTVTDKIPIRAQDNFALRLRDNAPKITHGKAALFNKHLK